MTQIPQSSLELWPVGNCQVTGLIDETGGLVWGCVPRVDGDPVFCALLNGDKQDEGVWRIELEDFASAHQEYQRNTSILKTRLEAKDGSAIEIVDFAPRFSRAGRMYRPVAFVRIVRCVAGAPRIRVRLAPMKNYGEALAETTNGTNHIRYLVGPQALRLTTDAPVGYVLEQRTFRLEGDLHFFLGPDEPFGGNVGRETETMLELTDHYWRHWVRGLATVMEWQEAVIRAAITLKLCVYEETGGIVAALTTSIPEHAGSERNWDYRYCWLRDAYFTVTALNRLSAVGTLERYLTYLRNTVAHTQGGHIQPVFGVALETDLTETIPGHLPGYRGHGPVRFGNQAAEHIQHDVYGHVILGASQAFFDERLSSKAGHLEFEQFEKVGERAYQVYDTPDAGIWEFRGRAHVHTSSAIMCWAACDRLARIARELQKPERVEFWRHRADEIRERIIKEAWNEDRQAFTGAFGGDALDASVLLMAEIGFIDPMDERYVKTVERIDDELREGDHVYRYRAADDFGEPETAFTACTFWHIDALARIGRRDEARKMFESLLKQRTKLGLLSEDVDTKTRELWGNFPQTYSMVGIINAASNLSRSWEETV